MDTFITCSNVNYIANSVIIIYIKKKGITVHSNVYKEFINSVECIISRVYDTLYNQYQGNSAAVCLMHYGHTEFIDIWFVSVDFRLACDIIT